MKPKGLEISRGLRGGLYGSFGILFLSGVAWLFSRSFLSVETEYGALPAPYEAWSMKVHGAAVPVFLVVFGWLFPVHITRGYRSGWNLVSGLLLLGMISSLILTGYLLYYSGGEGSRRFSSLAHSILGVGAIGVIVSHIVLGRRAVRQGRPARGVDGDPNSALGSDGE